MLITENNKSICITISNYQFPNIDVSKKANHEDANWLNCMIKYTDGNLCKTYVDACLETYDLEILADALFKIIHGNKSQYTSDFLEPYLDISISKVADKIEFSVQYEYEVTRDGGRHYNVCALLNKEQAIEIWNELKVLKATYPRR